MFQDVARPPVLAAAVGPFCNRLHVRSLAACSIEQKNANFHQASITPI
jgi:hypothetical protein